MVNEVYHHDGGRGEHSPYFSHHEWLMESWRIGLKV